MTTTSNLVTLRMYVCVYMLDEMFLFLQLNYFISYASVLLSTNFRF